LAAMLVHFGTLADLMDEERPTSPIGYPKT
jgi:hypothetical protein